MKFALHVFGEERRAGLSCLVRAGEYEAIYTNMPTFGLAKASTAVAISESIGAQDRLKSKR